MEGAQGVDELKAELARERAKSHALSEELIRLKEQQLRQHVEIEQEEEFITNKLLKTLRNLEKEKNQILMEIDREQEYLTNTLHRRMSQIMREKKDLENQLKVEQDYISLNLQKKIDAVRAERTSILSESRTSQEVAELCTELSILLESIRREAARDSLIHGEVQKANHLVVEVQRKVAEYEQNLASCKVPLSC
eukprot:TRINITY_DN3354_c0_g1_i3.p1 TRINITY_DN3354_c0_g1~~TRINITY_DN3354_c0_g1_i3.p1  ORF type:complete len:194 (-),score=56.66 TRINITY_DN3354_c0_g1_i3:353-934(-)